MKKIITIFALVAAFTTLSMTTKSTKVMTPNIPFYHETLGEIPPIDVLPDVVPVVWTVDNQTNCEIDFWLYFSIDGEEDARGFGQDDEIEEINKLGITNITASRIRTLFGLGTSGFSITKISAFLRIGTFTQEVYPGMSPNPVTISTGLPAPCNCLRIEFNRPLQKLIVTQGFGC